MKLFFPVLAAAMFVGACASAPETPDASARSACRNVDPPTGSRLVRKQDCSAAAIEREMAQDQARQLQGLQQQTTPGLIK